MTYPSISIITPTYNRSHMIQRTIRSIQAQTFENWELIIVDDASTDNTEKVVSQFISNDKRVRYIKQKTNQGACSARNHGIQKSRGLFIAIIDDDDIWEPDKLSLQYNYFNHTPGVDVVYCGFKYINYSSGETIKAVFPKYCGDVLNNLLYGNILGSPTPLIKRKCFYTSGLFDESMTSCQDWDMWIRIAQNHRFGFINKILASVSVHGNQISTNIASKASSRDQLANKYRTLLQQNGHVYAYHQKRIAILNALILSKKKVIFHLIQAIKYNPRNLNYYLHLIMAFIPPLHRMIIKRFGLPYYHGVALYH